MNEKKANRRISAPGILPEATLLVVTGTCLVYIGLPPEYHGAKTMLGRSLGGVALVLGLVSGLYMLRRAHMEYRWGALDTWLRIHVYTGLLALAFALLHSGWRFRPGAATAALVLLALTDISGIIGWIVYVYGPKTIPATGNLSEPEFPEDIYSRMSNLQHRVDTLARKAEKGKAGEHDIREMEEARSQIYELNKRLKSALRREMYMGVWLYFHIPVSAAFVVVACVHAFVTFYL